MPDYRETFTIDELFGLDETHRLFRYNNESNTEILSVDNIASCMVMADLNALDKSFFHKEAVPGIGNIRFVNDMKELSKAVLSNDIVLTIFFYDKNNELKCYKKRYPSQSKQAYNIMAKINTLTDRK